MPSSAAHPHRVGILLLAGGGVQCLEMTVAEEQKKGLAAGQGKRRKKELSHHTRLKFAKLLQQREKGL